MAAKYIAQGLLETWKKERAIDTDTSKVAPLQFYLEYQYKERYVALCYRVGVVPLSFGKWLCKPISSLL